MQRLRVLRGGAARGAQRGAQHHGHFPLAAGHVMNFGGLVDHLVHDERDEIAEHDVDDRAHAGHRRADAEAGETGFGNGRVDHAVGAELGGKAGEDFERRAGFGDVLAHQEDARIAAHFLGDGFLDGFAQGEFALRPLVGLWWFLAWFLLLVILMRCAAFKNYASLADL